MESNTLEITLDTDCLGEALQDYFVKIELIAPQRKIKSFSLPVQLDEDGMIPMTMQLSGDNEGMN
jgi:hypothetical protein